MDDKDTIIYRQKIQLAEYDQKLSGAQKRAIQLDWVIGDMRKAFEEMDMFLNRFPKFVDEAIGDPTWKAKRSGEVIALRDLLNRTKAKFEGAVKGSLPRESSGSNSGTRRKQRRAKQEP